SQLMNSQVEMVSGRLVLSGEMTVYTAPELLRSMLAAALTDDSVQEVSLAEVTELDTAGVQLLLVLRRRLAASGRQIRIIGVSPAASQSLTLCGLTSLLAPAAVEGVS
ncbi:MAG TPA: STAS domain-containing protein, partial [Steroidobacteraceae bacterium]